jgi:anti-sigma B factor antagonist
MADNIRILSWRLDINLTMVGEFRQKLQQFVETEGEFLVLNMQEVSYINSTALGIIADAVFQARKMNKELVIAGVEGTLEEIFDIVKFASFIHIFAKVEMAEAYFTSVHQSE